MKKMVLLILCLGMMAGSFGCAKEEEPPVESTPAEGTEEVVEEEVSMEEVYETKTPYGKLAFPEALKDSMKIEIEEDGDVCTVKYIGLVGEKEVPVFDLVFGGTKGDVLGTLPMDGEEVTVTIISHEYDDKDFTKKELDTLAALAINVNTVLQHMEEDYGFVYNM